jgi:hypothetical protein
MPLFEEHRMRKNGHELWAVETMIECKMDVNLMLGSYLDALDCRDLSEDVRCDFSYSVGVLIEKGADTKGRNVKGVKDWFIDHGRRCRYFPAAFRVISKL